MSSNTLTALLTLFGIGAILWATVDVASIAVDGFHCSAALVEHSDAR